MNQSEILHFVDNQFIIHDLVGWSFKFFKSNIRLGTCDYTNKQILINEEFINRDDDEVKDTILHEIAHVLTFGCNHNNQWKLKCVELGCKPSLESNVITKTNFKYEVYCPTCDKVIGKRYNRRRNMMHANCGSRVTYRKIKGDE